jgi:hypothetical protein
MVTEQHQDAYVRHLAKVERRISECGIGRHVVFFEVGEGTLLPDGTEDMSGCVIDAQGRVFSFWTGWDAQRGAVTFDRWEQPELNPRWTTSSEYRQAREAVGLPS